MLVKLALSKASQIALTCPFIDNVAGAIKSEPVFTNKVTAYRPRFTNVASLSALLLVRTPQ